MRQYEREDIDYATWYTPWMKRLARAMTRAEIERALGIADVEAQRATRSHLRAVEATHSMQGQSQRRAQTGNVVAAVGDYKIALGGALEIHELFPEEGKQG